MAKKFNIPADKAQTILDVLTVSPEWRNIYSDIEFIRTRRECIQINVKQGYVQLYTEKAEEYKGRRADYLMKNPEELDNIINWIIGN
jgi:hypothetical protein